MFVSNYYYNWQSLKYRAWHPLVCQSRRSNGRSDKKVSWVPGALQLELFLELVSSWLILYFVCHLSLKTTHFAWLNIQRYCHCVPFDKKLACITNYQEKQSFPWPLVLYIYIIRVTLNIEFDTVCLSGRHAQMAPFGVYPLVCPFSIWPGQGFYVELFLIDAFPSE